MNVYLAGPIFGCDDAQASQWRDEARQLLAPHTVEDPMDRDFRGDELANAARIVEGDIAAFGACDVILANAARPSWGTAMEVRIAYAKRTPVVAFSGGSPVSPWLTYHAETVTDTLADAVKYIHRKYEAAL